MLTSVQRAVCFLFSCSTGASCSPPCLAGSPESWPALFSVTGVGGAPGVSVLPCIVALQGVRDGDLYHTQPRGPSPHLSWAVTGSALWLPQSPAASRRPGSDQDFKAWNSRLGITFPFPSLLSLTPVLEAASFSSLQMICPSNLIEQETFLAHFPA